MKKIINEFCKTNNVECELILGSSGKLTMQVKEGAPYDVFLSANLDYPMILYNEGLTQNKPKTFAYGKLVLWTMMDTLPSITMLVKRRIKHIALANPRTAPYGKATEEVLKKNQVYEKIKDKMIFGESIAQTNQFIISHTADVGFTSMSTVLSKHIKSKGKWIELAPTTYSPIKQTISLLTQNKHTKTFEDFLLSEKAQKILTHLGYSVN